MLLCKQHLVLDASELSMDKQDNVVPLDVHYQPNRKTLSCKGHLNSRNPASNWHLNGCMLKVNPLEHSVVSDATRLATSAQYAVVCETVETSTSFACNSSFLSVDGMACLI